MFNMDKRIWTRVDERLFDALADHANCFYEGNLSMAIRCLLRLGFDIANEEADGKYTGADNERIVTGEGS